MLVDWFTTLAQLVNFLILIWLLKRFLYGPIQRAMQARQQRVADELRQAQAARDEALAKEAELVREREALEARKQELLDDARAQVLAWREDAMAKAKGSLEENRASWSEGFRRERERYLETLRQRVARKVLAVAGEVLTDLADADLGSKSLRVFLERLAQAKADGEDAQAFEHPDQVVLKLSQEKLDTELADAAQAKLKELFPKAGSVLLVYDPELVLGSRLIAGDHKWDWNLGAYLQDLENEVFGGILNFAAQQPEESQGGEPAREGAS